MSVPRWVAILSRTAAAVIGGYALSGLTATACALVLPLPRVDAVLSGMLTSFAIYAGAVVWVYSARTTLRAWAGLVIPAAMLGLLITWVMAETPA